MLCTPPQHLSEFLPTQPEPCAFLPGGYSGLKAYTIYLIPFGPNSLPFQILNSLGRRSSVWFCSTLHLQHVVRTQIFEMCKWITDQIKSESSQAPPEIAMINPISQIRRQKLARLGLAEAEQPWRSSAPAFRPSRPVSTPVPSDAGEGGRWSWVHEI